MVRWVTFFNPNTALHYTKNYTNAVDSLNNLNSLQLTEIGLQSISILIFHD